MIKNYCKGKVERLGWKGGKAPFCVGATHHEFSLAPPDPTTASLPCTFICSTASAPLSAITCDISVAARASAAATPGIRPSCNNRESVKKITVSHSFPWTRTGRNGQRVQYSCWPPKPTTTNQQLRFLGHLPNFQSYRRVRTCFCSFQNLTLPEASSDPHRTQRAFGATPPHCCTPPPRFDAPQHQRA